jgi:putative phage-type endonuclease
MILDCEQGTPEWLQARCGKVTASRISDALAEIKKGEAAARRNYRTELVVETLTGIPVDQFVSKEMQWGTDTEPFARAAYELQQDVMVSTVGFAQHPMIPRFGASPDGLIGDDGVLEIKCPNTSTHLECLLTGGIPTEHYPQMRAELACTGRSWCDFVSFDPRLPSPLQLFVKRFHRDEPKIAEMEAKVREFLAEVDGVLERLGPVQRDEVQRDEVQRDEDLTPILQQSLELARDGHGPQLVVPIVEALPEEWEADIPW